MKKILILIICLIVLSSCGIPVETENPTETTLNEEIKTRYNFTHVKYENKSGMIPCFSVEDSLSSNILRYEYTIDNNVTYGYMDMDFNVLSLPISVEPAIFTNGLAVIWPPGEGPKVINTKMEEINVSPFTPFFYNDVWYYYYVEGPREETNINGRSVYLSKFNINKYTNIDPKTCLVPAYTECNEEHDGSSDHQPHLSWGFMTFYDKYLNLTNEDSFEIAPLYEDVGEFSEGLAAVMIDGKWGYINENGEVVIDFKFDIAKSFQDNIAIVGVLNEELSEGNARVFSWGIINQKGEMLTDKSYSTIFDFNNGIAIVGKVNSLSVININGNELLNKTYDFLKIADNDIALVRENSKYMFIDLAENRIGTEKYEFARAFNEGAAAVVINNKWGYINTEGNILIEPQYESALDFNEGFALVKKNGNTCLIDKDGKEYLSDLYLSNISQFNKDGYALAYGDIFTSEGLPKREYYIVHKEEIVLN